MFASISVIYLIRFLRDIYFIIEMKENNTFETTVVVAKVILTAGFCVSLHGRLSVAVSVANLSFKSQQDNEIIANELT